MVIIQKNYSFYFWYCLLLIQLAIPVILILLPKDYFDKGTSMCLSVLLFHQECYGCGMTRAIMHLIHFDLESAIYFNFLSLIVFPILAIVYLSWFLKVLKKIKSN